MNTGFGLQASIEDAYGNVVTSASNTVKVALANNPTGAKLGGTLSVKASKGVATFSGLTLNKVGTGYTLQLSSSGLTGATTSPITVTSTGADIVLSATAGTSAPELAAWRRWCSTARISWTAWDSRSAFSEPDEAAAEARATKGASVAPVAHCPALSVQH